MKPAKRDIDPDAASHAGQYGDFGVVWQYNDAEGHGWYVETNDVLVGPFHTSQAAFGAAKDAIDQLIGDM